MADQVLDGLHVAIIAADGFEQVEVTRPLRALEKHGADIEIISLRPGSIRGMKFLAPGNKLPVDRTISTADPADYDGLLIPGGFISPDSLRQSERVLDFVREFDALHRPIATICHGPWVLVSAGLVEGRTLTSWPGIRDDVLNAGGEWIDHAVVYDDNWLSSRGPQDLRAFDRALVRHLAEGAGRAAPAGARDLGWGGLLVGTAAVAAAGLVAGRTRRTRRRDRGSRSARNGEDGRTQTSGGVEEEVG